MANPESTLAAGRRLARDLRSIRRKLGIDLKEILDATRLAEDVIEKLEETALMCNPVFNSVYLRSLYSSYGAVLKVSQADMLEALEEALSGHYIGSLATKYLGEIVTEVDAPQEDPAATEERTSDELRSTEVDGTDVEPEVETGESQPDEIGSVEIKPSKDAEAVDDEGTSPSEPIEQEEEVTTFVPTPAAPTGHTEMSALERFVRERSTVLLPNMSGSLILIVAGAALIAMIWFSVSWLMSSPEPIPVDPVQVDSSAVAVVPEPPQIVLADTFQVDLIAEREKLDPVRIIQDRDLRRSYWLPHLDTLSLQVVDRIQIERELMNTRILVDGFIIPKEWYREENRVAFNREEIQGWLDSLTTANVFPPRAGTLE